MKRSLMFLPLLALLISCQHSIHPNAIDKLDSQTYDTLTVAQAVLDSAKVAIKQGKIPETARPVINAMGTAYNALRDLWLDYRSAPTATLAEKIASVTLTVNQYILQLRGMGVKDD